MRLPPAHALVYYRTPLRRASLGGGAPSWVSALAADGVNPDLMFDFTDDTRGWSGGTTSDISSLLTCTRATNNGASPVENGVAYGRDASGNYQSFAQNTLRYDYSGGVRRLLVEEKRTNSIRNNTMQGAAVGSPGTAPTNWSGINTTLDGLARSITALPTSLGVSCIDFRWNGTTSIGSLVQRHFYDSVSAISSAASVQWTVSVFLAVPSGTYNFSSLKIGFRSYSDAVGTIISSQVGSDVGPSLTTTLQRFTATFTTPALTTNVVPYLEVTGPAGAGTAADMTLRIGWPQCELGAFATSPIPTSSAAIARPADVVSMTLPAALQGLSAYTLFGKAMPAAPTSFATQQSLIQIDSNVSDATRFLVRRTASTGAMLGAVRGGTAPGDVTLAGPWAQDASKKVIVTATTNDAAGVFDGGSVATDSTVDIPAGLSTLRVGSNKGGTENFCGGIEQIAIWGSRRTNDVCQSITT